MTTNYKPSSTKVTIQQYRKIRKERPLLKVSRKRIERFVIAFVIFIIYASIVFPYYQNIQGTLVTTSQEIKQLTKPPEPYTYQIPLYFSFNGSSPFINANETDFSFLLTITYPNGTLIPNEEVNINAIAVVGNVLQTLDHVAIIFPNSLVSPTVYDDNGFPKQGILSFSNPIGGETQGITFSNITIESSLNVKWVIDGDYTPIIGFFFKDGTSKVYPTTNFVIHVYPKEQLTQSENSRVSLEGNQASLELTEAIFWLSTAAIVALLIQIVDRDDSKCNYTQAQTNEQNKCPYLEDKRKNRFRNIVEKKDEAQEAKPTSKS